MNKLFCTLLCVSPLVLTAQQKNIVVDAAVNKAFNDETLYIIKQSAPSDTDSIKIRNGKFRYETAVPDDHLVRLILFTKTDGQRSFDNSLVLYVKKGEKISIRADSLLRNARVAGSPASIAWMELQDKQTALRRSIQSTDDKKARAGNMEKRRQLIADFIKGHPDWELSLELLKNEYIKGETLYLAPGSMALYHALSEAVRNSPAGRQLGEEVAANEKLAIGGTAPDIKIRDSSGKEHRLSEFRGKYVLVDFWASWCGPCRAEFPFLKKAYAQYKSDRFEMIGISVDHEREKWLGAIQKDEAFWVHFSNLKAYEDPEVRQFLLYTAVPQNWLLDPNGRVIAANLRGEEVIRKLAALFP